MKQSSTRGHAEHWGVYLKIGAEAGMAVDNRQVFP